MSLAKNVAWMLAGRWAYNLTTLISFMVIVRIISPHDFGIYNLALTFLILSDTFFSDGVENIVVRQSGSQDVVAQTSFWVTISISVALAVSVVLIAFPFGLWYDSIELQHATQTIGVIIIVQGAASVPRALLLRSHRSRQYATNSAISNLLGAAAGICAAVGGFGLWSMLIQQAVLHITMLLLCSFASGFFPAAVFDRRIGRSMSNLAGTMLWSTILNVLGNRLDVLMIGLYFGSATTGIYGLAKRLIQILQDLVASSFDKILLSMITHASKSEHTEVLYRTSVILQAMAAIPSFVGLALVSSVLIPLVFGSEWSGAVPLIMLMTIGGIFRSMVTIERAQQLSGGHGKVIAKIRLVELIIGLVLIVPFAKIGPEYMAVMFSIRYVIGYVLVLGSRVGFAHILAHIARTAAWLKAPLTATLPMVLVVNFLIQHPVVFSYGVLNLMVAVTAGVTVFAGTLFLLRSWWLVYVSKA